MIKEFLYLMKLTFFKVSLNRIFQQIFAKNMTAGKRIVEFGSHKNSKKNFTNFINVKDRNNIIYADKFDDIDKNILKQDLEGKLNFKDNSLDSVVIFNVLEHVYDVNNAIKEIYRCLDKNGNIIGSTPFIHRIHGAPEDFNRYTSQFLNRVLERHNFVNIQIKSHGYGPCTACYAIIFDYTKMIPILNNILLASSIMADKFINIFVKTDLGKIYPITYSFYGEKK